jgi:hypothetical protein
MSHARHAARRFADRLTMSSTPSASCASCGSAAPIAAPLDTLPSFVSEWSYVSGCQHPDLVSRQIRSCEQGGARWLRAREALGVRLSIKHDQL